MLLDEPFSALDAPVRAELRQRLRRMQLSAGISTVVVTHDPEEAALLADEVVVLSGGRILQAGAVGDVYRKPISPEVARLLGIDNLLPGRALARQGVESGDATFATLPHGLNAGTPVLWTVRPEDVGVVAGGRAIVVDVADLGASVVVTVSLGAGAELRARSRVEPGASPGSACTAIVDPESISLWPADQDSRHSNPRASSYLENPDIR